MELDRYAKARVREKSVGRRWSGQISARKDGAECTLQPEHLGPRSIRICAIQKACRAGAPPSQLAQILIAISATLRMKHVGFADAKL
eukprot:2800688-Pleurochrysis_carterae.AAC.8